MGVVKRASTWGRSAPHVNRIRKGSAVRVVVRCRPCGQRDFPKGESARAGSVGGGESPTLGNRTLRGCMDRTLVAEVGEKHLV